MDDDMDVEEVAEETVSIDPTLKEALDNNGNFITGNHGCIGCGELLALKIALHAVGKCVVVHSSGEIALLAKYPNSYVSVPFVGAGRNAAPLAAAVAKGVSETVVAYAGDGATREHMNDLMETARSKANVIYICYNNQSSDVYSESVAKILSRYADYAATASISHATDYIKKLKKAASLPGVKYIEVLAPCPDKWGFDTSLTVEVARTAVESRAWPLYEITSGKTEINSMPTTMSTENYFSMQRRFASADPADIEEAKARISKTWKSLQQ
ncbi:MAG TPA: thiamine pyrophosphate-dependent enzyme [archaeon]|nr:thiamine pyrophosphate-dependent enzyme [archaeon]